MNFREFQADRLARLAADPTLVDLGETNLWRSLANLVPTLDDTPGPHIHRCHLAQAWLATFGLPGSWAKRALISSGVRHSLSLIFSVLARLVHDERQLFRVFLPVDVYPVYGELARAAGLMFEKYSTLPELRLPADQPTAGHREWLLLPNPLKPAGRWITDDELWTLKLWLAADASRRIIIDAVYTFDTRFPAATRELIETDQAILLHSLSKGWLHPQIMGVALVPESDWSLFVEVFREDSPRQTHLDRARQLLDNYRSLPEAVAKRLSAQRDRLLEFLPEPIKSNILLPTGAELAGYLMTVQMGSDQLLELHRILAIPLSAFGSPHRGCCVLSTL